MLCYCFAPALHPDIRTEGDGLNSELDVELCALQIVDGSCLKGKPDSILLWLSKSLKFFTLRKIHLWNHHLFFQNKCSWPPLFWKCTMAHSRFHKAFVAVNLTDETFVLTCEQQPIQLHLSGLVECLTSEWATHWGDPVCSLLIKRIKCDKIWPK